MLVAKLAVVDRGPMKQAWSKLENGRQETGVRPRMSRTPLSDGYPCTCARRLDRVEVPRKRRGSEQDIPGCLHGPGELWLRES